jgi:hypothetical protein
MALDNDRLAALEALCAKYEWLDGVTAADMMQTLGTVQELLLLAQRLRTTMPRLVAEVRRGK